jgi:esterase/lipase superfamily enzyme
MARLVPAAPATVVREDPPLNRRQQSLWSPAIGANGNVVVYGHWGRPLLAFPSQQGPVWQYEERGMIDAIGDLIEAGRVKVYAVDSFDSGSWYRDDLSLEQRAQAHGRYEDWIVNQVVPFVEEDANTHEIALTGVSFGAYHAANFALRRADLFPLAICQSGVYDVSVVGGGERGEAVYFHNPADYVAHLHGEHLEWLRGRVNLLLVVGQGAWEDSTGALESTRRFAGQLAAKGIAHELDVWGHDVAHDWPAWRAQIAHHLPRFV